MKAKEFLTEIRDELIEIGAWIDARMRLDSMKYPGGLKTHEVDVQSSPARDPIGDVLADVETVDTLIAQRIKMFHYRRELAYGVIALIPNSKQRQVLILRYLTTKNAHDGALENLSWQDIETRTGLTDKTLYRLHGQGLEAFDKIVDNL